VAQPGRPHRFATSARVRKTCSGNPFSAISR
jgi:hypothetical protein